MATIPVELPVERTTPACDKQAKAATIVKWRQVASDGEVPCPRSLHVSAAGPDGQYVFGGYDGHQRLNDLYCFTFSTKKWELLPYAGDPPAPRDRSVGVYHDSKFLVFGGYKAFERINDFYAFDLTEKRWSKIPGDHNTPSPRHSHTAVVHRDSLYVFGGYDGYYRNDLYRYNFQTSSWSVIHAGGRIPKGRYRSSLVADDKAMYLFGGHDGTRHLNDVHMFQFETQTWSPVIAEGPVPIPRDSHSAVLYNNEMYIFGGSTGSAMNDFHRLDLNSFAWEVVPRTGVTPVPRFCHVAVIHLNTMYTFGGFDGQKRLNDINEYFFGGRMITKVATSTLVHDMKYLINNPLMSDVQFIVEDRVVYGHRVLCLRCPYFHSMFTGNMKETTQIQVEIPDTSYSTFVKFMEYVYTDSVAFSLDDAMELYILADKFRMERLQVLCENEMFNRVTIENAPFLFKSSHDNNLMELKDKCMMFIIQNFDVVSKTDEFKEMGRENMELVFELLSER